MDLQACISFPAATSDGREVGLEASDLELLRAAADGDGAAYRTLTDRHVRGLFRTAISLTSTRDDAEDVLQESLVGAFKGLRKFKEGSSVKTWLTSIVIRQAAKGWHRNRRSRETLSMDAMSENGNSPPVDSGMSTRSSATAVEQRLDLMAAVKQLPDVYREVIVLREIQGLSYDEIAQALSIPRGTVESRLFRARAELRARLSEYQS